MAVGSQGGQLSAVLPLLAKDVRDMQAALVEGLQETGHGLTIKDVEAAVAGVMQPYNDMVRWLFSQACLS